MSPTTKINPVDFRTENKRRLSTMNLFPNIPFDGLQEIERHMVEKSYAKGESVFLEDDPADFVWFVKQGHVKEIHHTADGRHSTLCMVGAKGLFGISAFIGGNYGFDSVAETDAVVFCFPTPTFQVLMGKYPDLAKTVIYEMAKLLRQAKESQTFSQESAEKRLLYVLLKMTGEFGETIPLNRQAIASMAGTSVETCIRTFSRLKEAGLIASQSGRIMVKNSECLKERMEGL